MPITASPFSSSMPFTPVVARPISRGDEVRIALAALPAPACGVRIRRENHDGAPVRIDHHIQLLTVSLHDHVSAVLSVTHQIAEDIVEIVFPESCRLGIAEEILERLRLSGWNLRRREFPVCSCAHRNRPFFSGRIRQLEIRMKTHRDGHGFCTHVCNFCDDLEHAILQAVSHLDGVSEWKLLHPHRLFEEIESARHPCGLRVGFDLNYLPLIIRC